MSDQGEFKLGRYRCRPHFKEEKKKQKKHWEKKRKEEKRKRKREEKLNNKRVICVSEAVPKQDADPETHHEHAEEVEEEVDNRNNTHISDEPNEKKRKRMKFAHDSARSTVSVPKHKEKDRENPVSSFMLSRGKKMFLMANSRREVTSHEQYRDLGKSAKPGKTIVKRTKSETRQKDVKELDQSLFTKTNTVAIGSGSFGNVFIAKYRGKKAVVKEIKRRDETPKERERCKQEVLHEGRMLRLLGDHPNLPFLFGVLTRSEPFALVMQFHGTGEESITLHKVVKERIFNKRLMAKVFTDIAQTLGHIHARGILHNDLKSNNVIIQREGEQYRPVIIDCGKSEEIKKIKAHRRSADYLVPEVREGKKQSRASDIFSFGKMLQLSVSGRSFFLLFAEIISIATAHRAEDRPSASQIVSTLGNIVPIPEN